MSSIFSSPKPKTPAVPAPPPLPQVGVESGDANLKAQRRRSGFSKTLITGDLTPKPVGKQLLGG